MKYAPTVLIVHPKKGIAKELASVLQGHGFHAVPLSNAVEAIEHVESLCFDVAVVSEEMPSALPELLFRANRESWLQILIFRTPEDNVRDMREFVLAVSQANVRNAEIRCLIEGAWYDGWHGEAGYDPWTVKLTGHELEEGEQCEQI